MSQPNDERDTVLVRRALELAVLGPMADPNPRVGAVIVDRDGAVVGEGHHRGAGTPHAEVDALARAGERARGGTAYVSLEPCNHTGRTGPCARALLDAGVARVYTPKDFEVTRIMGDIIDLVAERHGVAQPSPT